MKKAPFNQLDIDDLQDIGKYMFSIANGNHILNYSEKEYRDYLAKHPTALCKLLILYHASNNWGYDDPRMFDNYDEQWLASQVDPSFKTHLDFDLSDFHIDNLEPYQKAIIGFTYILIAIIKDWNKWLQSGSRLESVYSVLANNLHIDADNQKVLNIESANNRSLEMVKCIQDEYYRPDFPFESWELVIY